MLKNIKIQEIIKTSQKAGKEIMKIYKKDFHIEYKKDKSPLTEADKKSHEIIKYNLKKLYPKIPIISEENKDNSYEKRKNLEYFWMIDPLDGTKEFINKNGEFTVNIALIKKNKPILGVIYVPAQDKLYYGIKNNGSFKEHKKTKVKLKTSLKTKELKIVSSRSHKGDEKLDKIIQKYQKNTDKINFLSAGSSLKFCLIAEGKAHIYPRLAPTMEWDTAAGEIIAQEAGANIYRYEDEKKLEYNKEDLKNPFFIVSALD